MSEDEILTTDEVCALLKIKKATLYKYTSMGTGPPFYKIGKVNRWKRSEVLAWFDAHLDEVAGAGDQSSSSRAAAAPVSATPRAK